MKLQVKSGVSLFFQIFHIINMVCNKGCIFRKYKELEVTLGISLIFKGFSQFQIAFNKGCIYKNVRNYK